ncbi:MAG: riboflavin synthase [Actinobacteria bacterium]|nr:MAG: riboflavin synthase [Actinomycetota bacterium]
MFTGIVEELGTVAAVEDLGDAALLRVTGPLVAGDARPGDSIAVNGVCLTVVSVDGDAFTADVMKETLDRSALGTLAEGDPVNLERAATLTTRLGGHLVQGHVDGVGTVLGRQPAQHWETVTIGLPPGLDRYVVEKGSITVDGVSLTVAAIDGDEIAVSLIPTTLALTTLGRKGPGAPVNLEVDVIAKYVEKMVRVPR